MSTTAVPGPPAESQPVPPPSSPDGAPRTVRRRGAWILHTIVPLVPALVPVAIVVAIVFALLSLAGMSIGLSLTPFSFRFRGPVNFGWAFFGSDFAPPYHWEIGVFIVGSFLTAIPALFLSMAIGLGIAIASTTYLPRSLTAWLDPFVDLLAGIPSVVFGIWAYAYAAPYFGVTINPWLSMHLGFIPGFGGSPGLPTGEGLPVTIFILTLMALPITTLLIRDALRSLPRDLWESGLALGATRWETMRRVGLPHGMRGILSAGFLGFGRAFGETVAVAIVLGGASRYPTNFYGETGTMAATMFALLDSAYGNGQFLALLSEMAIVLLAITLAVNIVGRRFVSSFVGYEIAGM